MVPVVAALPEARPGDLPLVGEDVLQGLGEGLEDLFLPHGAFHHQVKPRAAAHGGEVNDPREVVPQIPREEVLQGVQGPRGQGLPVGLGKPQVVLLHHAPREGLPPRQAHVGGLDLGVVQAEALHLGHAPITHHPGAGREQGKAQAPKPPGLFPPLGFQEA